jgi:hypothetical protein
LSRFHTDGQTVDDTAGNQHAHVLRSTDNRGTDDPKQGDSDVSICDVSLSLFSKR